MFKSIFSRKQSRIVKYQSKTLKNKYQDVQLLFEIITEQQQIIKELFKQSKKQGFQNKLLKSRANFDAFDIEQLKELFLVDTNTA
ncbi:hypothetical protein [uncultured Aquimarina sp.]|uniref:hypothetical protein n=1 Tax=uncultured Aquimarina sp. TaxID=575652 RepID=UPI0026371615|nr:hypothetical protein [uncultured Aquimarina sp.]